MLPMSGGFASNLHDPARESTLKKCRQDRDVEVGGARIAVRLETVVAYGAGFASRRVAGALRTKPKSEDAPRDPSQSMAA